MQVPHFEYGDYERLGIDRGFVTARMLGDAQVRRTGKVENKEILQFRGCI